MSKLHSVALAEGLKQRGGCDSDGCSAWSEVRAGNQPTLPKPMGLGCASESTASPSSSATASLASTPQEAQSQNLTFHLNTNLTKPACGRLPSRDNAGAPPSTHPMTPPGLDLLAASRGLPGGRRAASGPSSPCLVTRGTAQGN